MDIDSKYIKAEWERLQAANREVLLNTAYVTGKNPPIITTPEKPKPDNRIPVPMAKMAVMTVVGYAGRPGDITTEYEPLDTEEAEGGLDAYQQIIKDYSELNDEPIENSELLGTALAQGKSYELWWVSEDDGEIIPEYKIVPPAEACPVFTDSLKPEMEAFIRFWTDKSEKKIADVYYPHYAERWTCEKDSIDFVLDPETIEYPYTVVPAIEFTVNMAGKPIYQAEKPLIDSYDSAISKSQNEVDRFNAAILELPGQLTAEGKAELQEGDRAIFDDLYQYDKWPEYLQKNLSGINEFYKTHSANLERLFHKSIGIPDISDESFAGNQSGVAIAFKLIPLEFLTSQIEAYFRQGLIARKQLYDDFINFFNPEIETEGYKIVVTWKRNIPIDEQAKVEAAGILSSVISPEALLRWLPNTIVPDVQEELDRLGLTVDVGEDDLEPMGGGAGDAVEAAKLSGIQINSAGEIIANVTAGTITREAGIDQLMIFLGLSREQAEAVMGKVVKVSKVVKPNASPAETV